MKVAIAIAAGVAAMAGPAVAADQFDLLCKGQERYNPRGKWVPSETHYRIDLDKRLFCHGDCRTIGHIQDVQPTKIVLQKSDREYPGDNFYDAEIDRETGQWSSLVSETSPSIAYFEGKAACVRQDFSGFPEFKTKF